MYSTHVPEAVETGLDLKRRRGRLIRNPSMIFIGEKVNCRRQARFKNHEVRPKTGKPVQRGEMKIENSEKSLKILEATQETQQTSKDTD